MLSIVGLCGPDWVIIAADSSVSSSIICMSEEYDRIAEIGKHNMIALAGETGDSLLLSELIIGNVALYKFLNSVELTTDAVSHYIRNELRTAVRRNPYQVNLLLGGYDHEKPSLYYLDYLGTRQKIPFGAQGYAAYFVLSVFDKWYKPDMTFEEGKELMAKALQQIKQRFLIQPHGFIVKVVDKDGIRRIDL